MGSEPQRNNQIYENGGKLNINYSILVNDLMKKGVRNGDDDRSPDSERIIFCSTQKGDPFRTFQNIFAKFEDGVAKAFITEVGRIAEFICDCMQRMQLKQKDGEPLWTDNVRDAVFAAELRRRLYLGEDSPMRAEMVALCCMKITGEIPRNFEHLDEKNPEELGYNRSGTFSLTVTDNAGDMYLLQVIVASRRYSKTTGLNGLN